MSKLKELFSESKETYSSIIYESKETFDNGEFKYKVIIALEDFREMTGDANEGIRVIAVSVKLPEELPKDSLESLIDSLGLEDEETTVFDVFDAGLYGKLEYGTEVYKDWDQAIEGEVEVFASKLPMYTGMFGFFMDRPMNAVGNTGWDFMDGKIGFNI